MPDHDDLDQKLRERFGLPGFRPWQREAIDALLTGPGRALVVAPTGGGKSLCYQLPAAVLDGHDARLSPLDRADGGPGPLASTARGDRGDVPRLDARRARSARAARAKLARGDYKLVYAAPERLASDGFRRMLSRCRHRARRDRRGALHRAVGPRLPARLPAHRRAARAARGRRASSRAPRPPRPRCATRSASASAGDDARLHARCSAASRARTCTSPRARSTARARRAERCSTALDAALGAPRSRRAARSSTRRRARRPSSTARCSAKRGWTRAAYHAGLEPAKRARVARRLRRARARRRRRDERVRHGDRSRRHPRRGPRPAAGVDRGVLPGGRAAPAATAPRRSASSRAPAPDIALRRRLVRARAATARRAIRRSRRARGASSASSSATSTRARAATTSSCATSATRQSLLGGCGHCDVCQRLDGARTRARPAARRRRSSCGRRSRASRARRSARASSRSPTCCMAWTTTSRRASSASRAVDVRAPEGSLARVVPGVAARAGGRGPGGPDHDRPPRSLHHAARAEGDARRGAGARDVAGGDQAEARRARTRRRRRR